MDKTDRVYSFNSFQKNTYNKKCNVTLNESRIMNRLNYSKSKRSVDKNKAPYH